MERSFEIPKASGNLLVSKFIVNSIGQVCVVARLLLHVRNELIWWSASGYEATFDATAGADQLMAADGSTVVRPGRVAVQ
jgi:hypothetical protein